MKAAMNRRQGRIHLYRTSVSAVLLSLLISAAADAQGKRATSSARQRTGADDAAEQEALDAKEAREQRAPTVVKERKKEKVSEEAVKKKPTLTLTEFSRRGVELKVAAKRKQLISTLNQILDQKPSDEEKPELLFQKAELFLEESRFHFFEGMKLEDEGIALENQDKKSAAKRLYKKRDAKLEESRGWIRDAVLLYQEIEQNHPKFRRMPEVLYALGRAFWEVESYKKALPVYRRIIKQFPKSQYVADAWLAFGEYYFELAPKDQRDVKKALNAYVDAAKYEDSPIFGYAVYKQGWCHYNLSAYKTAADKFKEVVLYSDLNSDILGKKKIQLAKEARSDFVGAFSHYGDPRRAKSEFEGLSNEKEQTKKMLEKLANIYYDDGKDRNAIVVYRELMALDKSNTRNPLYQGRIVDAASRIGEKRQVVAHAKKLGEEYTRVRKVFAKTPKGSPKYNSTKEDLEEADSVSDYTLRRLATTWHNEAKKTRDDQTFEQAYELYGDYLKLFPKKKEAYEIRFFYAELLNKLERFDRAGEEYLKVFNQKPKGKWAAASAEEAVRAYQEVVSDYDRKNKQKPVTGPNALKPRQIPEVKKKFSAACKNYIENYPKGDLVVEAEYRIARIDYDYNHFREAIQRFNGIVKNHTSHPRAEQAANLVLDTHNLREDWKRLNDTARAYSKNRTLMKSEELRPTVLQVLEESSFKLIVDFEDKREFVEAGDRYLAFSEEFPKSVYADKALANSAAMYTRAGEMDRAIKVRLKFLNSGNENIKKSPLRADQMYSVATSYEQIVDYKRAAEWQEKFYEAYPKDSRSKDALFNASVYRQGVGQTSKAIADRETYLRAFPKSVDSVDVSYSIPEAWVEAGNSKKAVEAFLSFAKEYSRKAPARALNAQYEAVRILEKRRSTKSRAEKEVGFMRFLAKRVRSAKDKEIASEPLGYLAFIQADKVYEGFTSLKIASANNPAKFRRSLGQKRKASDRVYAAYTKVVKLGDPEWAVASLYRIGQGRQHLVDAITAVPPPRGLTEDQAQLFADKLAEQTLPIEEQAADAMVLCLDESARFGVFSDWAKKCLSYLEKRRPDTFPKNDLELRTKFAVPNQFQERGKGLVLQLPTKGKRADTDAQSQPMTPQAKKDRLKIVKNPRKAKPKGEASDGFDFDGEEL